MPCYYPLKGYLVHDVDTGTQTVEFFKTRAQASHSTLENKIELPCGRCIGCRLEHSRQWAVRCMHEASLHDDNCFVTLTYDEDHVPSDNSLNKKHFQDFMKRLRKNVNYPIKKRAKELKIPYVPKVIRYYHCGEYGENFGRPHYHACLFGIDFDDKEKIKDGEHPLYYSAKLQQCWPLGFHTIGELTFESAAYVSRYCTKKMTGPLAEAYYEGRQPEYATMSRRPGIGKGWVDSYFSDVYPSDELIVNGKPCKPPRYYDNIADTIDPEMFATLKENRLTKAVLQADNNTPERLLVREKVAKAKLNLYKKEI